MKVHSWADLPGFNKPFNWASVQMREEDWVFDPQCRIWGFAWDIRAEIESFIGQGWAGICDRIAENLFDIQPPVSLWRHDGEWQTITKSGLIPFPAGPNKSS